MRSSACLVLVIGLSLLSVLGVGSAPGAGDAAHIFRSGIGARARGMGGAYVASGTDATALFWNPAALIQTPSVSLAGVREVRYEGLVSLDSVAGAVTGNRWGAGVMWYGSEMYSVYHAAGAVSVWGVGIGIGAKVYSFGLSPQEGRGIGVDVGAQLKVSVGGTLVSVGLVSRDVAWTRIVWQGVGGPAIDQVAWVTRLGVSADYQRSEMSIETCAAVEVALRRPPLPGEEGYWSRALQLAVAAGVEVRLGWLALRVGGGWTELQTWDLAGGQLSAGAGVSFGGTRIDAAVVLNALGFVHVVGAEFRFGSP